MWWVPVRGSPPTATAKSCRGGIEPNVKSSSLDGLVELAFFVCVAVNELREKVAFSYMYRSPPPPPLP